MRYCAIFMKYCAIMRYCAIISSSEMDDWSNSCVTQIWACDTKCDTIKDFFHGQTLIKFNFKSKLGRLLKIIMVHSFRPFKVLHINWLNLRSIPLIAAQNLRTTSNKGHITFIFLFHAIFPHVFLQNSLL